MTPAVAFSTALELLKIGKRVRRMGWRDGNFLHMQVADPSYIYEKDRPWLPWRPTPSDLVCEDWESLS